MRNRGNFIDEIVKVFDKDHSDYYYGRIYEISRKGMTVTKSPYDFYWFGLSETEFIEDPENRVEEIPISEFIDWIEKEGIEKGRFMYDFQFEHQVFSQEKCFIPGKKQTIQVERLLLSTEFDDSDITYSDGQSNCNLLMWLSPNSDRTEWDAIVVNPDDNYYKTQFATLKTVSDLQRLNTIIPQRYLSDYDVLDDEDDDCLEDIMNNYLDQDEDADE